MPKLNISETARAAGKSRGTIYRAIKTGKLKAITHPDGSTVVDTNEIERVYGIRQDWSITEEIEQAQTVFDDQSAASRSITLSLEDYERIISRIAELERDKFELYGILLDYRQMLDAITHSPESIDALHHTSGMREKEGVDGESRFPFEIPRSHSEQLKHLAKTPDRRLPRLTELGERRKKTRNT